MIVVQIPLLSWRLFQFTQRLPANWFYLSRHCGLWPTTLTPSSLLLEGSRFVLECHLGNANKSITYYWSANKILETRVLLTAKSTRSIIINQSEVIDQRATTACVANIFLFLKLQFLIGVFLIRLERLYSASIPKKSVLGGCSFYKFIHFFLLTFWYKFMILAVNIRITWIGK